MVKKTYANDIDKFNKLCFTNRNKYYSCVIYHDATADENNNFCHNYFTTEENDKTKSTKLKPYINNVYDDTSREFHQCIKSEFSRHFHTRRDKRDWRWASLLRKANPTERFEDLFYELDTPFGHIFKNEEDNCLVDIKFDKDGYVYFKFQINRYTLPHHPFQFMKVNCLYNDIIYEAHAKSLGIEI